MLKVLIVDDNNESRSILESFLNRHNYQAFSAANGRLALDILEKNAVDLIISDILMPEMDGYMFCNIVKSDPRWKDIPFIFYSATFTSRQDEIFALKLGASRFIRKPIESDLFLNIIQEVLQNRSEGILEVAQPKFKEEKDMFKVYSERIIKKLENKVSELEESEEHYRSIFENSAIGLYRTTPDGRIIMANPTLVKMLGFDSFEELSKLNLEEEGFDIKYTRSEFKKRIETEGKVQGIESVWKRKDNSLIHVTESAIAVRDSRGVTKYYEGTVEDITARKKAEEELRESEKHYRELIDGMNETVWIIDFNGNLMDVNRTASEVLGYSKEELLKIGLFSIDSSLKREDIKALARLMPKDKIQIFETTHKTKEGKPIPVEIYSSLIDYHGKSAILSIARDITERKQAEAALRESEERYRAVVENSQNAILIVGEDFKFIYVNDAFCTLVGSPYDEIIGHDFREFLDDESKALVGDRYQKRQRGENVPSRYEFNVIRSNGEIRRVEISSTVVKDSQGKLLTIAQLMDLTERKRAEEDLIRIMESAQAILWHSPVVRQEGKEPEFLWKTRYFNLEAIKNTIPLPDYPTHNINDSYYFSILEEDRQAMDRVSSAALKSGADRYSQEFRLRDANGVIHWLYEDARIKKIDESHFEVVGVITEITERKKAETDLRLSEEKFKSLFEYNSSGVAVYEAVDNGNDFIIRDLNKAGEKIDKVKRSDVIGKSILEVFPGVKDFGLFEVLQQVWRTGKSENFPVKLYKDNRISGWRDNYVFKLPSGEIVAVYNDLTKQKQDEEEKRKSEENFRLVWENSVDGMRLTDENGTVVMVNQSYCKMVGLPRENLEGQPFTLIYAPETQAENMEHYLQRFSGKINQSYFEREVLLHNGRKVWFSLSDSYFEIAPGKRLLLTIIRDITEEKMRQIEKEELQNQIVQLQKMEAVGNLAGGVAHDFNNLLTIIQGYTQMLMAQKDKTEPDYQGLKHVLDACNKAANLTRQLLLFSRKQPMEFKPVNINNTINNLLKMIKRLIGENIKIVTNLKEPIQNIEADESNIEQVIINLVVNARDAMPNGGTLTISTENVSLSAKECQRIKDSHPGRFVRISVADTGDGIPSDIIEKIFEPFFTTKEAGKGTGLGLSVVYGIIKKHNGWINVQSEVGQGAVFDIYLPVTEMTIEDKAHLSAESQMKRGNGEKILIIEDSSEVLKFIAEILRQNGYTPIMADNAVEAIEQFQNENEQIDLILADVVLPDRNGVSVSEEILTHKEGIPVILYSGYAEESIMQLIRRNPKFIFIQKPFKIKELLDLIYKKLH
ncbi:MAG TPA: PAS domain S-box protein [Candidatus Marinimicrobia bacterium]|nr:PAS domain S-box protein [Candidatus Neomarinimicrobiota bacterium]